MLKRKDVFCFYILFKFYLYIAMKKQLKKVHYRVILLLIIVYIKFFKIFFRGNV
jgi:hypothetical protein